MHSPCGSCQFIGLEIRVLNYYEAVGQPSSHSPELASEQWVHAGQIRVSGFPTTEIRTTESST